MGNIVGIVIRVITIQHTEKVSAAKNREKTQKSREKTYYSREEIPIFETTTAMNSKLEELVGRYRSLGVDQQRELIVYASRGVYP